MLVAEHQLVGLEDAGVQLREELAGPLLEPLALLARYPQGLAQHA